MSDMKSNKKNVQLATRFTVEEKRRIERAARKAGETASDFCRRAIRLLVEQVIGKHDGERAA